MLFCDFDLTNETCENKWKMTKVKGSEAEPCPASYG